MTTTPSSPAEAALTYGALTCSIRWGWPSGCITRKVKRPRAGPGGDAGGASPEQVRSRAGCRLVLTGRAVPQHVAQPHTGPDAELGERGPQVSVDRVRRYAELGGGQPAAAPGADEVRHPPLSLSESAHAMRGARRWRAGVLAARSRGPDRKASRSSAPLWAAGACHEIGLRRAGRGPRSAGRHGRQPGTIDTRVPEDACR